MSLKLSSPDASDDGAASAASDVSVLVIHVESPNVLFVRKSPLSDEERHFLRAVDDYCAGIHARSSSGWRTSLNERQLHVGDKYFVLDGCQGATQWRRGLLTNVVTVSGGHRACVYLIDEARSVDVRMNHMLPMPEAFGRFPPLLRKVIITGIQPYSLVTDDLTCQTKYGPTSSWDTAAIQYARKLFLDNSSLSRTRLERISIHPESRMCFADISLCIGSKPIPSYAQHLKELRFATDDDDDNFFAHQSAKRSQNVDGPDECSADTRVPLSPFRSDSSVALVDYDGTMISCYKPDALLSDDIPDKNNNDNVHDRGPR